MKFPDYIRLDREEVKREICKKLKCNICSPSILRNPYFEKGKLYCNPDRNECSICCFECERFKNGNCNVKEDESKVRLMLRIILFAEYKKEYKKLLKSQFVK